jgi:hypothetical protein
MSACNFFPHRGHNTGHSLSDLIDHFVLAAADGQVVLMG